MSTVTITFKAKRGEYLNGFAMEAGYKVPRITHNHVTTKTRDSRVQLFLQGLNNENVTAARLKKAGVSGVAFESDSTWTIRPYGNGFMAEVSREIEV